MSMVYTSQNRSDNKDFNIMYIHLQNCIKHNQQPMSFVLLMNIHSVFRRMCVSQHMSNKTKDQSHLKYRSQFDLNKLGTKYKYYLINNTNLHIKYINLNYLISYNQQEFKFARTSYYYLDKRNSCIKYKSQCYH